MSFYSIRPDRDRTDGWKILEVADVPFYVEPSHLFLLGWIFFSWSQGTGQFSLALIFCFVVFISILLHEAGHALCCRAFGQRGVTVTMHFMGGTTFHQPSTPWRNLSITLAGPAVTLVLYIIGFLLKQTSLVGSGPGMALMIEQLYTVNKFLLILNMLPIYPMDGGQALLHLLKMKFGYVTALRTTAKVSLCVGGLVVFVLLSRGYGIFLPLIIASMLFTNWDILKQSR